MCITAQCTMHIYVDECACKYIVGLDKHIWVYVRYCLWEIMHGMHHALVGKRENKSAAKMRRPF